MTETFGEESVVGDPYQHSSGQTKYRPIQLANALGDAREGSFLIEAEFEVGSTFQEILGIRDYPDRYGLEYRKIRPDIIEVLPPRRSGRRAPGWALVEVAVLLVAIAATAASFSKVSRTAALLLVPYLLWTGFASVLNFSVWRLNR
jgi:hypothetical protein